MADATPNPDAAASPPPAKPAPIKAHRSSFMKKLLTETGSVIDLGGRALVAVAFAALFIKPQSLPFPGAGALFGVGVILVVLGIYTKAEAER